MRARGYVPALLAIVVSVWFVIGAREAHDVDAASALLAHPRISAAAGSRAASLLSSAAFLYPGVDLTLLRAQLEMERHDYAKAKPLVDWAVASEPDNLKTWISALDLALVDPSAENTHEILPHLRMLDPVDISAHTGH